MSEKHRALPSWMAKKEEKVSEKQPLKSRRKRKTARAAFYCMNERELLEAAVSYLTTAACEDVAPRSDRQVKVKAIDTAVKTRAIPATSKTMAKPVTEALQEESSDCDDAQETTYVSETDVDITEVETVPYTGSPQGQRSGPVQTEKNKDHSQMPADAAEEDDDALRLVREIFFT